jgi:predicted RNA binding protein YcfA (HicA-like mRNA interferase family)
MIHIQTNQTVFGGPMSVKDAIKLIEADGWRLVSIKGSHSDSSTGIKHGRVTIACNPDMDLHPKTLEMYIKASRHRGYLEWLNTR